MDTPRRSHRPRYVLWGIVLTLSAAVIWASLYFTESPPPNRIAMATGVANGAYAFFGDEYQKSLQKFGLAVDLHNTNGSVENLRLLLKGDVDVAFVQAGTSKLVEKDKSFNKLRGIAAIYTEPLWVFYSGDKILDTVAELKGKRISVGPKESGTEAVSVELLAEHDINAKNTKLENHTAAEAVLAIEAKQIDVAMIVSSYKDDAVQKLMRLKGVHLMSFKREVAYNRRFRYLNPVKVAAGLLDLREDIPPTDIVLLAPAATLVCREDLHPRVVEQILKTAQKLHDKGSRLDAPKAFPTLEGLDVPPHEAADTFMKSGESFLSRVLPFWAVRLVVQMKILVLPLLIVWIPVFKIFPALYQMRINALLKRHYTELREAETSLMHAATPGELRDRLRDLETLRKEMEKISRKVPGLYQREVYHWRLHISLVRDEAMERLRRMEEQAQAADSFANTATRLIH